MIVHSALTDGAVKTPLPGNVVADHQNVAGCLIFSPRYLASTVRTERGEMSVYAVSLRGAKNLFAHLLGQGESFEGCVVGSGVAGILEVLSGHTEGLKERERWVRDRGGEFVVEVPPVISPEAFRRIREGRDNLVPALFYHGRERDYASRPSSHPATRFSVLRHPLDEELGKNKQSFLERIHFSLSFPPLRVPDDAVREFWEKYGDLEEIHIYGKFLPLLIVADRFVRNLPPHCVINIRGSGGASAIVRRMLSLPPPEPYLRLDRFFSPDRTTFPDLDFDVSDQEAAWQALQKACDSLGLRCYRTLSRTSEPPLRPSAAGTIIVPADFALPTIPVEKGTIPTSQIPSAIAEQAGACKIDILHVRSLALLSQLSIPIRLGYELSSVPLPPTHKTIPHLRSPLGEKILRGLREAGKTELTLRECMIILCLLRPSLVRYLPYLLERYLCKGPWKELFPRSSVPTGKVFLWQEALLDFVSKKVGKERAEWLRKELKARSPSAEAISLAKSLGINPDNVRYLLNLSHARSYAAVIMVFAYALREYPQQCYQFFEGESNDNGSLEHRGRGSHAL